MSNLPPKEFMPKHVGIIMDGNGRWANDRGLPRTDGHIEGAKNFIRIMDYGKSIGLEAMTFYAFSTENWKRPENEVKLLMKLFRDYMSDADVKKFEREKNGFYFRGIGEIDKLPKDLQLMIRSAELQRVKKDAMMVNIAINYGGRQEIVHAAQELAKQVAKGNLQPEDITEDLISQQMYTKEVSDPDLIIRPSGELRLSNFLTWQSAYSELWFDDVLWPDFSPDDLDRACMDYAKRDRRFGGLSEEKKL